MSWTISEIAHSLDARVEGNGDLTVTRLAEPPEADAHALALAMSAAWEGRLREGSARAAVLSEGSSWRDLGLEAAIIVKRPRLALSPLSKLFAKRPAPARGIHPSAIVDESAKLASTASIGPFTVIGPGCIIGENCVISGHATLTGGITLADDVLVMDGVRIGDNVQIGSGSVLHQNAIIGSEGFSFVTETPSSVEQARQSLGAEMRPSEGGWLRIYALGGVEIGQDVEIGAGSTVDAGTIRPTRIGHRTKIDNLVHIAHNVSIGDDCLICAQTGIAGSAVIGDRVVLAGQCGVSDNIRVGHDVVAGGGTKIYSTQPAGRAILGAPAVRMETQIEINKAVRRLPRIIAALQKQVSKSLQND